MSTGRLFIISAPSGAGKTSLVNTLVGEKEDITVSVSHTTRGRRPGENDGVDYNFTDLDSFQQMIADDVFLEHAKVFDNYYGTSRHWVDEQLAACKDVILEIDWQGARTVRERIKGSVSIFILPPSHDELEARLRRRGGDEDAVIQRRMRDAVNEISHYAEYDFIVVNDDFHKALADLESIIRACHHQREHVQATLKSLVKNLMA